MKKTILCFVMAVAFMQVSLAQVKWNMDPMHTNIRFEVNTPAFPL